MLKKYTPIIAFMLFAQALIAQKSKPSVEDVIKVQQPFKTSSTGTVKFTFANKSYSLAHS